MKKKWHKGKIFKTTDGFFNGKENIKKPRRVLVIDQRKDDGALALSKVYSQKGKSGKAYIENVILSPKKHSSLTEDSIVGKQVYIGVQEKDGKGNKTFKPIYDRDMIATRDKVSGKEFYKIKKGVLGGTKAQKKSERAKLKKWHRHFK